MSNMKQDQEIEEFLNKGLFFEERLLQAGALIREQSKNAYPYNLLDARLCLLAIYYHLISYWESSLPNTLDQPIPDRLQLIRIFFQGVDLTESAISEGQYFKAAAMLGQDLGIGARLRELGGTSAQNAPIPNIKDNPPGMNRFLDHLYGAIPIPESELVDAFLKTLLAGSSTRITTFPALNEEAVRGMYELHIRLVFQMVRELMLLYTEMYHDLINNEENQLALDFFDSVMESLEEIGFHFEKPGNN
jgi:hypothetical protein